MKSVKCYQYIAIKDKREHIFFTGNRCDDKCEHNQCEFIGFTAKFIHFSRELNFFSTLHKKYNFFFPLPTLAQYNSWLYRGKSFSFKWRWRCNIISDISRKKTIYPETDFNSRHIRYTFNSKLNWLDMLFSKK